MGREVKVESSIAVQGRVSIVELAELEKYWKERGVKIKSMSQLIGWSISLLREILNKNGVLEEVKTVAAAHRYLEKIGIYQKGMKKRAMKKIANAIAFESLRVEGVKPEEYVSRQFNTLHNKKSVKVLEVEEATKVYEEIEKANRSLGSKVGDELELEPVDVEFMKGKAVKE